MTTPRYWDTTTSTWVSMLGPQGAQGYQGAQGPQGTPGTVTAGGDLGGNYPNPQVLGLAGKALANWPPVTGQRVVYNGTYFVPAPAVRTIPGGTNQSNSYTPNPDLGEFFPIGQRGQNSVSPTTNFTINSPGGSYTYDGQKLLFRIWAPGSFAITWAAPGYYASGSTPIPTTIRGGADMHVLFVFAGSAGQWICLAADPVGY